VAIYLAGVGAVLFTPDNGPVSTWWPSAGLAISLLAVTPRHRLPVVLLGIVVFSGAANFSGGRSLELSAWYGVVNATSASVCVVLLRRGRDRVPRLDSLGDFVTLLGAAASAAALHATLASPGVVLHGDGGFLTVWISLFVNNYASIVVIVPVALTLCARGPGVGRWELPVQVALLAVAIAWTFSPDQTLSLSYLPLPILLWATLRLGRRVVCWELVGLAAATTFLSSQGYGPFGFDYIRGEVGVVAFSTLVQVYLLVASMLSVPLAIAVDRSRELIAELLDTQQLTSATLDTTAALILVTDMSGTVIRVNHATTSLTGYSEPELVGRPIEDLPFAPPGSTGFPAGLPETVRSHASRETGAITRDGDRKRILWNTSFVLDSREQPTYVVLTGIDMTAERAAAGLNQRMLEAAITTAMIGIDPRGRITLFNTGAERMLGYDKQDMIGRPFTDLIDPAELAERAGGRFDGMVAEIGAEGATGLRDWTWVGADGRRHTVATTLSVVADDPSSQLGYLCVGRDVTEARISQDLLVAALDKERLAVERLRQLDTAKNEFVSTISHELRTPLASIVGYTEMLQDGTTDEPTPLQRKLLGSIERSGRRLISLCEDLLTLGSIDAGATKWERDPVDLRELVHSAADAVRPLLTGRDLLVSFQATQPVPVLGDRAQLDRVLINLLSNAIKFTEDGGRIDCRVELRGSEAWLEVTDTGIGIPEAEQSGMFERFFRSSTAQSRAIQGTGLGLAIVAETVAAHGGRIDLRSAHLQGTTVTVRLPAAPAATRG